jgi:hypothetical protein
MIDVAVVNDEDEDFPAPFVSLALKIRIFFM